MITFRVFPHNVSEEGQGQLCVGPIEQALQLWPGHEVTETADVHPHLLQSVRLCRGGGGRGCDKHVGVVNAPMDTCLCLVTKKTAYSKDWITWKPPTPTQATFDRRGPVLRRTDC